MKVRILEITCVIYFVTQYCSAIKFIPIKRLINVKQSNSARRYALKHFGNALRQNAVMGYEEQRDADLKLKMAALVEETIDKTLQMMETVEPLRAVSRNKPAYKIGYLLSIVKKCRALLSELFNIAVKHKDEWKTLEELKIYELIVRTGVDINAYIEQIVEIHESVLLDAWRYQQNLTNSIPPTTTAQGQDAVTAEKEQNNNNPENANGVVPGPQESSPNPENKDGEAVDKEQSGSNTEKAVEDVNSDNQNGTVRFGRSFNNFYEPKRNVTE